MAVSGLSDSLLLVEACDILPPVNQQSRKTVAVVAALILDDAHRVLAVRCPAHKHGGGWEFPGGKIEPGELARDAVAREISEELGVQISVGELLHTVEWEYPAFHLSMQCYVCRMRGGNLQLREHTDARWLTADDLQNVDWLPADVEVLPHVGKLLK